MKRLLAIETATEACSAALLVGDEIQERFEIAPQQHAQLILHMAESLLADAGITLKQLDAVAFGRGPGSFTGVRIAAGVIQGIAFGADLPVVPVSSLAAMAQSVAGEGILAAFDARMGQVYWGVYVRQADGLVSLQGEECVCLPEQVSLVDANGWVGAGSGWQTYAKALQDRLGTAVSAIEPTAQPHASGVASLGLQGFLQGHAVAAELARPVYLRNEVAKKPGGK